MQLHEWQKEAFETLRSHDFNGVIKVASGKGKTVLGLYVLHKVLCGTENKGLIVVPTIQLAHQWQKEATKFFPELTTSLYYGAKQDASGQIIISVINTAARHPFTDEFSIKILDEVHHYGAELFQHIFNLPSEHTIGLSATPERNDEGDLAIRYGAGSVVYSLHNLDELKERFELCTIILPFTPAEWHEYQEASTEYQRMLILGQLRPNQVVSKSKRGNKYALKILKIWSEMTKLRHFATHKLPIIKLICEAESNEKIIIFSESIPYSESLGEVLENSIVVHSDLTKKEVLSRLEQFRSLEKGILIAPRMIDEGYDVPNATVSIVASFTRSPRQMIQRDGRLLRENGKVRRYTLVIENVEEEKFARILRETETEELALRGEWLYWNKGFVSDIKTKQQFQEHAKSPEKKKEWLMQRLDFFARTNQMDEQFYQRHLLAIQRLQEEFPDRWIFLEKQEVQTEYKLKQNRSEEEIRQIKNTLRKINAKMFLPEGVFHALFRFLDNEAFALEEEDKEVLQRLVTDPNYTIWPEETIHLAKELLGKLSA